MKKRKQKMREKQNFVYQVDMFTTDIANKIQ